ncbi:MAG TPA: T9SS type A sorting domain-containing protein [Rubricoccaceae bacterium]|jgi:hypothetical protein
MASSTLPSSFLKDSVWYAAAAAAVTGIAVQDASAQVRYRDIADVTVEDTFVGGAANPITGPLFDFDNDGDAELLIGEVEAGSYTIGLIRPTTTSPVDTGADTGTRAVGNTIAGFGYFRPLAAGASVGPNAAFITDPNPSFTFNGDDPNAFIGAGDVYIGIEFTLNGAPALHYGWIRVNMAAEGTITVKDLAYNATPGTAIMAGNMGVATEPDALAEGYRFSPLAPNPTTGVSSFDLTVGQTETVHVEAFDALGRSVAVLHDGPLAAGQTSRIALDAADLPAGVYVVRVSGDSFVTARRVTVAR